MDDPLIVKAERDFSPASARITIQRLYGAKRTYLFHAIIYLMSQLFYDVISADVVSSNYLSYELTRFRPNVAA